MLIPSAHYEELDASAAGISPNKTIVVPAKGSKAMLIFGIVWTIFWTIAYGVIFYIFITDPSSVTIDLVHPHAWGSSYSHSHNLSRVATTSDCIPFIPFAICFIGTGLLLIHFGLRAVHGKAWIAVTDDSIYCMRGGTYRPKKYKKFPRNPELSKVYSLPSTRVKDQQVYKIVLGGPYGSLTIASGLFEADARGFHKMLESLLAGED